MTPPSPTGSTGTVITVAPTGTRSRVEVPHLPLSPDDLASTAADCERIGASVLDLQPRRDWSLREVISAVRERSGLLVRIAAQARAETLTELLDAGADILTCPLAGFEAGWESRDFLADLREGARERGIAVQYEASELSRLVALEELCRDADRPVHVVLVLGAGDTPGDAVALVQALSLLPAGATFTASGVEQASLPVLLTALATGGHLRLGLADTVTYAEGMAARDNAQLVARAAGLAKIAQRPPVSVDEARALFFD